MNRLDFEIIKNVIKDNSRILDVGCENGDLLKFLNKGKQIDGRGLEISQKKGGLENIYKNTPVKFCVISFTSDWVYPTKYSKEIVDSLNNVGANVSFVEIQTDKGHDAFLLGEKEFNDTVRGFLKATANRLGF